jgi:hypothetical protein
MKSYIEHCFIISLHKRYNQIVKWKHQILCIWDNNHHVKYTDTIKLHTKCCRFPIRFKSVAMRPRNENMIKVIIYFRYNLSIEFFFDSFQFVSSETWELVHWIIFNFTTIMLLIHVILHSLISLISTLHFVFGEVFQAIIVC